MITREQIEAIRAAMVAPIIWAIIGLLLLAALIPLGKKCKAELRSMAAACREGGLKKFCQYLFIGWGISVAMYVSAVKPNDPSSHPAPQRAPIHRVGEQDLSEAESDTEPQPLPPLRITEVERTDEAVSGTLAWDGTDDVQGATTIDVFVAHPALTNEFRWVKPIEVAGPVSNCPWSVSTNELGIAEMPSVLFVKMTERISSASTMADKDGDLLPDIYELKHGTNPYVPDFESVPKLSIGEDEPYATLRSALADSRPYSVLSLPTDGAQTADRIVMPSYPVLITGPKGGYSLVETSGAPCAFELHDVDSNETLFQNLYLKIADGSNLQSAFWCGSQLPIGIGGDAVSASANFRNVYVRTEGSSGRAFGWFFRGTNPKETTIDHCVVNAAGSTDFTAVCALDSPSIVVTNCTFVNFPDGAARGNGIGIHAESVSGETDACIRVVNSAFDDSFTNAYPLARIGSGPAVEFEGCVLPDGFRAGHAPDVSLRVATASNCLAWTGHATAGGIVEELGIGALAAIGGGATLDSDDDGLYDIDEIGRYGTNPFAADTDGDGVSDRIELLEDHTNPLDPRSHMAAVTVSVRNSIEDVVLTNYYGLSTSGSGWSVVSPYEAVGSGSFTEDRMADASLYAECYTDINGNGAYDPGVDVLRRVPAAKRGRSYAVEVEMGDVDHDGVNDYQEWLDQTDPMSAQSYLVRVAISITNTIDDVTLTNYYGIAENESGWNIVDPSWAVVSGSTNAVIEAHEGMCVKAFVDINRNGVFDAESDVLYVKAISKNKSMCEIELKLGDRDNDGVDDAQEYHDGTDPYSSTSLKIDRVVAVGHCDYTSEINDYYQFSATSDFSPSNWTLIGRSSINLTFSDVVSEGYGNLFTYRDFNGNGVFDQGVDGFKQFAVHRGSQRLEVTIGDSDSDGVRDRLEFSEGTDPLDGMNFKVVADVYYEMIDRSDFITNYVQTVIDHTTPDPGAWEMYENTTIRTIHTEGIASSGCFYGLCFRDVNRNGVYDEDVDIFYATAFRGDKSHDICGVLIGDEDGDGVLDSEEITAGTNPRNGKEYEFDLQLTMCGLYREASSMRYELLLGSRRIGSVGVVEGRTIELAYSGLRTSTGEKPMLRVWEDLNGNGRWDSGERRSEQELEINGHVTTIVGWFELGDFDADHDGMHDDWERSHDLDPNNMADAEIDSNENGMINLHEYYASVVWDRGLEGTALYSFCRSIDDRISISPWKSAAKHIGAGLGLRRNPNSWEFGINTSCASPWNSTGSGTRAGTAISKRHIIFADHYRIGVGATVRFVGMDDVVYERTLLSEKYLVGTDIMIGLLSEDLPDAVLPAVILPGDFCMYLGDAKRLPMLMYDYSEHSIVTDSDSLFATTRSANGMRPCDPSREHYFEDVVSGDSGDPKFFVSGDTAILVCCLLSYGNGNSGIGPFVTYYKDRIQAIMDSLCPGYQLREFDFSVFRSLDEIE